MKNILICYEGGAYDGCIWEWNFCVFNNEGEFRDIYSSGALGCDTEEKILDFMKDPHNIEYGTFHVYDLMKEEFGFADILIGGLVVQLVKKLNELHYEGEIDEAVYYKCDECGDKVYPDECEGISCDPVGCGGIVIMDSTKICSECYSLGSCSYCGEYCPDEEKDDEGYCEDCSREQNDGPTLVCITDEEEPDLVFDREYQVFNHVYPDEKTKELMVKVFDDRGRILEVSATCFNVPYEMLNPNQLNVFKEI